MKSPKRVALIAVTKKGIDDACLLRERLRAGEVYRPSTHGPARHGWEHGFEGPLADQVAALFGRHDQLVFFLAAGAVTRLIAPCLASKETDPGVLAIDEAGRFVIPLLSGHVGGANAFARTVAGCLGAIPVVTTASDVISGLSLDMLEEEFGWTAEPRAALKDVAMALVNREPVTIVQEVGAPGSWLADLELPENVTVVNGSAEALSKPCGTVVLISERLKPCSLAFRPKSLVLGVGCERGISLDGLMQGLQRFLEQHDYSETSIDTVASITIKTDEPAILALAKGRGWNKAFFSAEELAKANGIATPSSVVEKCVGAPGVAEPAALLAAGTDQLLLSKQVIRVAGCAQAMTFALARHSRYEPARDETGKVYFVGAGPGDPALLTVKTQRLLHKGDVVIYAGSLIPEAILRQVPGTAELHNSAHLTLEQVMDITLRAARQGKRVLRLHSGDTSIYSAIQEQIAVLEREGIEFEVVPGVSSFQALAAALKSEFTLPEKVQTVILTRGEGATPMPERESLARLAEHQATLCIFLSARLADEVQAQLLEHYPPATPVAVAHRVSWPDEQIVVTRLDRLGETVRRHDFQRTTLIAVGEAVGGRHLRSHLYDERHGHIFRKRTTNREQPADGPAS